MAPEELFAELTDANGSGWALLERLVSDKTEETLHLEFKRIAGGTGLLKEDKRNLARAVSAFANTEGGVLLFGVGTRADGAKVDHADTLDLISDVATLAGKVQQHMNHIIEPTVAGVQVCKLCDPGQHDRGVVVVLVPRGVGAHRARGATKDVNDKYYLRTETGNVSMPHAMLSAMFGQHPAPVLKLSIVRHEPQKARLFVENHGRGLARGVLVRFEFFKNEMNTLNVTTEAPGSRWYRRDVWRHDGSKPLAYVKDASEPLFPGDAEQLLVVTFARAPLSSDFVFGRLDAEGAAPVTFRGAIPPVGSAGLFP